MVFEEIDSQHRLLFAISNELLEISNPKSQEPEIKYLLRHLRDYVEKHFFLKKNLWKRKNFRVILFIPVNTNFIITAGIFRFAQQNKSVFRKPIIQKGKNGKTMEHSPSNAD